MIARPSRTPCAKPQPIDPKSHSPRKSRPPHVKHREGDEAEDEGDACLTGKNGDLAEDLVDLGLEQVDVGVEQPAEQIPSVAELAHEC